MRRLDGLSAFMVYSDRPRWYQHTLKIAVLDYGDNPMPPYEALLQGFSEGIVGVPILKWKLARVPFGLNHPVWVESEDFDIRYHMRHIHCPGPGD
ncbi:MAG: wax ester/triacylglycerol synthase domain-containing protein, partial [Pseudomonadales bacterium]